MGNWLYVGNLVYVSFKKLYCRMNKSQSFQALCTREATLHFQFLGYSEDQVSDMTLQTCEYLLIYIKFFFSQYFPILLQNVLPLHQANI